MTGDDQRPKYHGKRRNAFVGNIKYYRPPRYSDKRNEQNDEEESCSLRSVHDRIRAGGIKHRLSRPGGQPFVNKPKIARAIDRTIRKDREGDEIMGNTEGTSSGFTNDRQNPYRVRNIRSNKPFQNRIQREPFRETKSYAIGEKENGFKQLLPSQSHCKIKIIDQTVFDLIVNFLQQYYMFYDSNRQELLAAYHKNALFSLSLNVNSEASFHSHSTKFGSYFKESRNLIYVNGIEKKYNLLHSGNLDIVAFLNRLPKTEHDSNSLKLDTCFFSNHMITFSVIGIFKEGDVNQKIRPTRSFQRVFVCVPNQTGQMLIVNEQYTISNPSKERPREKEVTFAQEMITAPVEENPILAEIQDPNKKKMVQEFSKFSNLNFKWSKDCLEYSEWNYEKAADAYLNHKSGIPSDAFLS